MQPNSAGPGIRLVLGVSSVGKSSYIKRRLTGPGNGRILLAYELQKLDAQAVLDTQDCTVHYNMLLPWNNDADAFETPLHGEPTLAALLERRTRLHATVLVARPSSLAKRILLREKTEPELRAVSSAYPIEVVFDFVSRVPFSAIYDVWFDFLSEQQIPFDILSAEDWEYRPVHTPAEARLLLRDTAKAAYSSAERSKALDNFTYAYQNLDHIDGLESSGADRNATLEAIKPFLSGRSALDIGCAQGFFCFKLEKLGFAEVIGTEVKKDRFLAACAAREVTGSHCELLFRDIFSNPFDRTFDTVLLLNVLHHLTDPIAALRQASRMCARRLIIEFATLTDAKFAQTCPHALASDNAMPLIGVSLLAGQDQTFLFSHEALRRICLEHAQLFSSIEFLPSPMSAERSIAICSK